jgi:CspA family cold shock protein
LLHVTILKRDGFDTINEGAHIVCEAHQRNRGLQVFRILSIDQSASLHPAEYGPPRTHVSVTPTSGLEKAVVKWFNRLRGFGFVTRGEDTPDIFVHMEIMRRYGFAELKPGQMLLVRYGDGSKGLMASEIRPVDYTAGPSSH